jgi:hypothetical protein
VLAAATLISVSVIVTVSLLGEAGLLFALAASAAGAALAQPPRRVAPLEDRD